MISFAQALPIGNAIRLVLAPPDNAVRWRLLRKAADDFTGEADPDALVVLDGDERSVIDGEAVVNGQVYYYRLYTFDGSTWAASPTIPVTATATYREITEDVLMTVRERLDLGLQVEVQRGTLRHPQGRIPVRTAFPWEDKNPWPVVTVHLSTDASDVRGIGEILEPDEFDAAEDIWNEAEGWFARTQLDVIGWSQNPDERQALRQAIRRIIIGNLPVFDDKGFVQIDFRIVDAEEPGDRNTIIYKAVGSFSCLAPVQVSGQVEPIRDVVVTARPYSNNT